MSEHDRPSNWALATAAFRESFLTRPPTSGRWLGDRHWLDEMPVSEDVFLLAYGGHLQAARVLWLQETA